MEEQVQSIGWASSQGLLKSYSEPLTPGARQGSASVFVVFEAAHKAAGPLQSCP